MRRLMSSRRWTDAFWWLVTLRFVVVVADWLGLIAQELVEPVNFNLTGVIIWVGMMAVNAALNRRADRERPRPAQTRVE